MQLVTPHASRYDAIADDYQRTYRDLDSDPRGAELMNLVGALRGLRVLDLACGSGRVARHLARCGALVTGVDLSAAMLDIARVAEQAEPLGIGYLHGDCTARDAMAGEGFDVVVCHFGLSDIDDLEGCLATVARVLVPGGAFVFSIVHPCFPGWATGVSASWPPGAGYYKEGFWLATGRRSTLRTRVGANHRMLSTYLNALSRHGLVIEETAEPGPPPGWTEELPAADPVPVFLIARCRRR